MLTSLAAQFYTGEIMISLVCGLEPNRGIMAETTTAWPREFEEYEQASR